MVEGRQRVGAARASGGTVVMPTAAEMAAAEALVQLASGGPAKASAARGDERQEGAQEAVGAKGRGRKRKDAAADAQLAAEMSQVWWAKTRAAVCGVLRRVMRKRARREGGERGGGASGSGGHLAGSKRAASTRDACDRSTLTDGLAGGGINARINTGKKSKTDDTAYERRYPERTQEQERRGEGPDRPKRKRVDGSVCYANSGEGSKRRCDATGRPPGRPPG